MNPNYTEFKFPQIKAHPWAKVFRSRTPPEAVDVVAKMLALWHSAWDSRPPIIFFLRLASIRTQGTGQSA